MQPNIKLKLSSLVLLSKSSKVLKVLKKKEKNAKSLFPANSLSASFYALEVALLILMGH